MGAIRHIIRSMPYPPNFSRTAARIIDPATGASTWALGSHRCIINKGSFTINAKFIITHIVDDIYLDEYRGRIILSIFMFMDIMAIPPRRGRLAVMVYIIKYILA